MNKFLVLILLSASPFVFAQTAKDVMKQLESLQGIDANPKCEDCEESKKAYTPQDAIRDINSGKLVFLGRDLLPSHEQNRTCVYKSEMAYILYHNCMSSKKEAGTTDIEVISFNGGMTRFYIENNKTTAPVSTVKRSDYDMVWTVSYEPTPAPGKLDMGGMKKFVQVMKDDLLKGSCYIGNTFKAQDMDSKATCRKVDSGFSDTWIPKAESFWKEPGDEWYKAEQYLRKTAVNSKF